MGSTNRKADALQIDELKRLNWMNAFDEQAIPDLKSEAIDFRAASELFAPYRQMTAQACNALRIVAEEGISFTPKHLTSESIIEGVRREDRWTVPLVAIREALMNAIVHADYAQRGAPVRIALFDDRIETENPGLLPRRSAQSIL